MLIVIDNFLPEDSVALETIQSDALWKKPLPYSWLGKDDPAQNVWQQMCAHICLATDVCSHLGFCSTIGRDPI